MQQILSVTYTAPSLVPGGFFVYLVQIALISIWLLRIVKCRLEC